MITKTEMDSLTKLPIYIDYSPESHREGLATYFRAYLQEFMNRWLRENPNPDGSKYNLYSDGLRIYTTIDSRLFMCSLTDSSAIDCSLESIVV